MGFGHMAVWHKVDRFFGNLGVWGFGVYRMGSHSDLGPKLLIFGSKKNVRARIF